MTDILDIYRATKLVVDRHGEDAPLYALAVGSLRRTISFVIAIVPMPTTSYGGYARWAFATDQLHRDRHGRTPMLNG
jgi:hypothetical protein